MLVLVLWPQAAVAEEVTPLVVSAERRDALARGAGEPVRLGEGAPAPPSPIRGPTAAPPVDLGLARGAADADTLFGAPFVRRMLEAPSAFRFASGLPAPAVQPVPTLQPAHALQPALGATRPGAVPLVPPIVDYNLGLPGHGMDTYVRALAGVIWINWVGWQFDWFTNDKAKFTVTRESIARNFEAGFEYDQDSFKTNFFGHPYHGSLYFGAARGAGLSFWESLPFPWIGSFVWEFMGETQLPSVNDFVATSFGGTVLGEALFRLSNEVFDDTLSGGERLWRELGGAALSPMYGVQRVMDGRAWRDGAPPRRRSYMDIEVQGGINRLSSKNLQTGQKYEPSLHVGIDVEYGDTLPENGRRNIEAYQYFEAYATASFMPSNVLGAQLYIQGPMYGWNKYLADEDTAHPDNNVFAVTQFIDFESSNLIEFGGAGLGLGDYLIFRFRNGMRYRLSGGLQFAVLSGVTSLRTEEDGRTYNFSAGGTADLVSRLNMRRYGELGFRGRNYVTAVIDTEGTEIIGYYRFWYELPIFERMGVGMAPILAFRSSVSEGADPRVLNVATVLGELYMYGAF